METVLNNVELCCITVLLTELDYSIIIIFPTTLNANSVEQGWKTMNCIILFFEQSALDSPILCIQIIFKYTIKSRVV